VCDSGHFGDDEALSALLDGALSREAAAALRRRLSAETALARRLEELRRVDEVVRAAYAGVVEEPTPSRVVDVVRGAAQVVPPHARAWAGSRRIALPFAAVAGLAAGFLIALLALRGAAPPGPPGLLADRGAVVERSPLHDVLETLPSGETRDLGSAWSATPRLTFLSTEGLACRRVDLAGAGGSVDAVVCRRGGVWRAELIGYAPAQKATGDGLYHPATGETPSRVDDAINSMMQGRPLGRDGERDWIRRGWSDARHE
jgi:hypothetical protein